MTRLNGMPIQMFAISTETIAHCGDVSQLICSMPNTARPALTIPDSLLSIHAQVDAETSSGSSQGTRKRARRVPESGNFLKKKSARARPIEYWNTIDTSVKTAVLMSAGTNVELVMTSM